MNPQANMMTCNSVCYLIDIGSVLWHPRVHLRTSSPGQRLQRSSAALGELQLHCTSGSPKHFTFFTDRVRSVYMIVCRSAQHSARLSRTGKCVVWCTRTSSGVGCFKCRRLSGSKASAGSSSPCETSPSTSRLSSSPPAHYTFSSPPLCSVNLLSGFTSVLRDDWSLNFPAQENSNGGSQL